MAPRLPINLEALPCSLRPVVLTPIRSHLLLLTVRFATTNPGFSPSALSPTTPPPSAVSFVPGSSNIPNTPPVVPGPTHSTKTLLTSDAIFTSRNYLHAAEFVYSAPRFLDLPYNTQVPEICLLGRSNVGKSTLVNALAGLSSSRAGRVHGSKTKGPSAVLAITSATAGRTRTINAYGFGPPPRPSSANEEGDNEATSEKVASVGGRSRSQVRADTKMRVRMKERHRHCVYVMDMPGYGLNSRQEWGEEIVKYLSRRKMLRGAVLLVDSVAGIKAGDRDALALLAESGVKTAVVLTKGDKVASLVDGQYAAGPQVLKRCKKVWEELETIGRGTYSQEGHDGWEWEREIFVTGAGDPRAGGFGVSGARLAICRLAGLVKARKPREEHTAGPSTVKIVPYDQIQLGPQTLSPMPIPERLQSLSPMPMPMTLPQRPRHASPRTFSQPTGQKSRKKTASWGRGDPRNSSKNRRAEGEEEHQQPRSAFDLFSNHHNSASQQSERPRMTQQRRKQERARATF